MPDAKKPQFDRVIGIDLGNGLVKVRSVYADGRPYRLVLPSEFAYLKDAGNSISNQEFNVENYEIDGVSYIWGEDIVQVKETKPTSGYDNRYKTEAFRIMVSIVLGRVVKDLEIKPTEKNFIVTGVPSGETGTQYEKDIKDAFLNGKGGKNGLYEMSINSDDYIFKVADVHVTAQALATVLSRYLDEDGSVLDDSYERLKVAVIDVGAGTTDLDILDNLRRLKEHTSIPSGFKDVYEAIRGDIRQVYPSHRINDYDLFQAIQSAQKAKRGNTKKITYLYKPSKIKDPIDFTNAFHQGIQEVSTDIQQAVIYHWKDQTDIDEILLAGGSAAEFESHLSRVIDGIIIPENAGESNVEGYYRLGMEIMNYEKV